MSPTRRRSSRLRGSSAIPGKSMNFTPNRLASLTERDETPTSGTQSNLDAIVSSPLAPRTPATVARVKPSLGEMHPSKVQQSTTKQPDSGLLLGFTDIEAAGGNQPSGINQQTPSKTPATNPAFDFRFARPGPQLGPEAQRMMNEIREEALRIKAKLAAERAEEARKGEEDSTSIGARKIAQPKGKVGRFSDIHMAEFKKMDSIAGHPSAFRTQSGRSTPVKSGLKRSQSRAKLDEREELNEDTKIQLSSANSMGNQRLENDAPAKRARKALTDDTSTARPVSRDSKPSTPCLQSNMLASVATLTQSSLARAATIKTPASQIPSLSRSPSKPNLANTSRGLTKSATMNNISDFPRSESKILLHSPGKMDRLKSILRYPSASAKKPSAMPSIIPSFARSPSKPNLGKALPSIPTTPGGLQRSKDIKHVNFTPETVGKHAASLIQNSPSPMKSGIPSSASNINFHAKPDQSNQVNGIEAKPADVQYPSISSHPSLKELPKPVEYPSLAGIRQLPKPPRRVIAKPHLPPSVPGTFTFRSDHTINFGQSPTGFGSSPGQSSVRQVRPSIFPSMPGSFPGGNKENTAPVPSIPHGTPNKKRRRADSDNEEEDEVARSPKKRKAEANKSPLLMTSKIDLVKNTPSSTIPSPAKKKGLSLSRLNMLARPKVRK